MLLSVVLLVLLLSVLPLPVALLVPLAVVSVELLLSVVLLLVLSSLRRLCSSSPAPLVFLVTGMAFAAQPRAS